MRKEAMTVGEWLERKGVKKGRTEGRIQEKQEVLSRLMEREFGITERERKTIRAHSDAEELDAAIDEIVSSRSKASVLKHLRPARRA
jgi:hypothetical protein